MSGQGARPSLFHSCLSEAGLDESLALDDDEEKLNAS